MTNKLSIYKIKKLAKYIAFELTRMEKETPNDAEFGQRVRSFVKEIFYRKNGDNKKESGRGICSDEV